MPPALCAGTDPDAGVTAAGATGVSAAAGTVGASTPGTVGASTPGTTGASTGSAGASTAGTAGASTLTSDGESLAPDAMVPPFSARCGGGSTVLVEPPTAAAGATVAALGTASLPISVSPSSFEAMPTAATPGLCCDTGTPPNTAPRAPGKASASGFDESTAALRLVPDTVAWAAAAAANAAPPTALPAVLPAAGGTVDDPGATPPSTPPC